MKNKTILILVSALFLVAMVIVITVYSMYQNKLRNDDAKLEGKVNVLLMSDLFKFNKPCLMLDKYSDALNLIKNKNYKDVEYYKLVGSLETKISINSKKCDEIKKKKDIINSIREEQANPTTYFRNANSNIKCNFHLN